MSNEPSAPFGFTISTTKSDGRTWLTITRNDGVSASLSCQTSHDSGETIASQVVTEFAAALSAPAQRVEEGKSVAEIIRKTLRDYRQIEVADEDGNGYPLVDALTLKGRGIDMGEREIDNIVSELMYAVSPFLAASPAPAPHAGADAARDILAERERQKAVEGWTPEHDDQHGGGELAQAAAVYALCASTSPTDRAVIDEHGSYVSVPFRVRNRWPWDERWLKPTSRRRDLVKAGALIIAEIERLDRAALEDRT